MHDDASGTPKFMVVDVDVVATAAQRRDAGLDHWVDGTMGFHRRGLRTTVFAPNGRVVARHELGSGDDLLGGLCTSDCRIEGLPDDVEHASGGPVLHDPRSGLLVLVYHGETFRDGNYEDFYSFLGLAVSEDEGRSFHDLGRVVTSDLEEHDPTRPSPVELGSGGFVVRDGWMNLYFHDRSAVEVRRNLGLARCRVDEVVDAAIAGRAPSFRKYWNRRFDQPGLGGSSAELMPWTASAVWWHDVAHIPDLGGTLLVYSTVRWTPGGAPSWNLAAAMSSDGISWSRPVLLFDEPVEGERLYVTIDSTGQDQRTIDGDSFHLYTVRSTTPYRWDDGCLERVTVRWRAAEPARSRPATPIT